MRKWSGRGLLYPLVFLLAALLWLAPLWREPAGFAFWRPAAFTDLLVSHFPNAELVRRSISTWGEIPLWNPTILSGAPFAADPLAGLFYPPFWLGILLPAGLGFNLIFLLHLAWAGWGASWLAGREGIGRAGRLTAGLLFAGTPKLIGHIGLGHLTFVAAIAWTPWILLLAGEAATAAREGSRGWIQRSAAAGAAWGLAFLADPRWLIPSGLAAGLYAIWGLLRDRLPARRETARAAGAAGAAAVFAAGIAAALALPLAEFASLSTRALLTDADRMAMQLPALRLVGVFVPEPGGWPEWLTYTGIVTLGLAAGVSGSGGGEVNPAILTGYSGAVFQLFAHGLISAALFMLAGSLGHRLGTRNISDLGGIARTNPLTTTFLMIAFLASLGLPGLVGFVAEISIFIGTYAAFSWWVILPILSVVLTAAYYLWAAQRAVFGPLNPRWEKAPDLHRFEVVPLAILSVLFVVFGIFTFWFFQIVHTWSAATLGVG